MRKAEIKADWLSERAHATFMTIMQQEKLETGFLLDRQWFWLRGEMEQTKRPTLLAHQVSLGRIRLCHHRRHAQVTKEPDIGIDVILLLIAATRRQAAGFTYRTFCRARKTELGRWYTHCSSRMIRCLLMRSHAQKLFWKTSTCE